MLDSVTDLGLITSDNSYGELAQDISSMEQLHEIINSLDRFFLQKIAHLHDYSPFVNFAVQQIFQSKGTMSMDALTANIHASRRYVEKTFSKYIGMTPKRYARLIRVKKASLMLLDKQYEGNISQVAGDLNYYDPSHFLKDFKAVAGRTPSNFLRQQGNLHLDEVEVYLRQWDFS